MTRLTRQVAVAAAAGAVLLASACTALPGWSSSAPQSVLIGVDLNLSGRGPHPGTVFRDALQLQLEQVNEQELAGRWRLELRMLDNRGEASSSAQNLAELSADPDVAAIITAGCPMCVIDAASELTVPVVSLDSVDVAASASAGQVFRLGPNAADNADVLSLAMTQNNIETVGLITVDDPYGELGRLWVADAAERDNLTIVSEQQLTPADEDSLATAAQAIATWQAQPDPFDPPPPAGEPAGPDAVVVWAYPAQAAQVASQLREAGYQGPLYLDMAAAGELFLPPEAAALVGATLVFTSTPVADQRIASSPALTARQDWLRDYTARYGTYHLHSSFAADALRVLADALSRADQIDPNTLRDKIESTRIDGLTGQIRFTADQHSGLGSHSLVTLTATGDRWT